MTHNTYESFNLEHTDPEKQINFVFDLLCGKCDNILLPAQFIYFVTTVGKLYKNHGIDIAVWSKWLEVIKKEGKNIRTADTQPQEVQQFKGGEIFFVDTSKPIWNPAKGDGYEVRCSCEHVVGVAYYDQEETAQNPYPVCSL